MLKIRRPLGRLIFNMGIAIPGKTVFLIETAPRCHYATLIATFWFSDQKRLFHINCGLFSIHYHLFRKMYTYLILVIITFMHTWALVRWNGNGNLYTSFRCSLVHIMTQLNMDKTTNLHHLNWGSQSKWIGTSDIHNDDGTCLLSTGSIFLPTDSMLLPSYHIRHYRRENTNASLTTDGSPPSNIVSSMPVTRIA